MFDFPNQKLSQFVKKDCEVENNRSLSSSYEDDPDYMSILKWLACNSEKTLVARHEDDKDWLRYQWQTYYNIVGVTSPQHRLS